MTDRCTQFANTYLSLSKEERPKTSKQASKHIDLPSAVSNQAIRDIKSKSKAKRFKKLWPGFNNQNFRIEKEISETGGACWKASFPTLEKRVGVPVEISPYQKRHLEELLSGEANQGTAHLVKSGKDWYIYLSITLAVETTIAKEKCMGIDLGLITLLAAETEGKTLFFPGSHAAYIRRHFASIRRELQKKNAHRTLRRLGNKEHRWITDQNHKISRKAVNFAKANHVTTIRMEDLTGIRWTKKQGRKQRKDKGRSLHSWAFYQLQRFIEYKANLAGIKVEYVNREKTSLICSVCGTERKRPAGRWYICTACGSKKHIDANAAANISNAISGIAA